MVLVLSCQHILTNSFLREKDNVPRKTTDSQGKMAKGHGPQQAFSIPYDQKVKKDAVIDNLRLNLEDVEPCKCSSKLDY